MFSILHTNLNIHKASDSYRFSADLSIHSNEITEEV